MFQVLFAVIAMRLSRRGGRIVGFAEVGVGIERAEFVENVMIDGCQFRRQAKEIVRRKSIK